MLDKKREAVPRRESGHVGVRLSDVDIARVDRWATERAISRSEAIRLLIERV